MGSRYRIIQVVADKPTKIWCTAYNFDSLCTFCQYLIDGALDGDLNNFYVVWEHGSREGYEPGCRIAAKKSFYEFCEAQGIRKRTFEERMGIR